MEWQPYRLGSARRVGLIGTLGRVLSGSTSVPLKVMDRTRKDEEIIWKQYRLHSEERPRQIKMNAAMINSIAQHLKAREWARAIGKTRRQPHNGNDLEKAAEQWKRQTELEPRGFLATNQRSASR